MKKISYIIFLILLSILVCPCVFARDVSSCSNLTVKNECISSREKDSHKECSWDESSNKCNATNRTNTALELSGSAPDVDSCAGFISKELCTSGETANAGKFGCAWNDKYEFCSPTGLAYLSCGGDAKDTHDGTDAYDIPVFLPRITSYAVTLLKTVTPVILIIMSMIQLIKAISSQNEDEMKKARSALVKKLIAATLIFFVTTIVQFVIKQVADSDEVGSASQCLSCFVNNDCSGVMYYTDGYGNCYNVESKSQVDCNTYIGVKQIGTVEDVDNSSSGDNSSRGSSHSGGNF